MEERKLYGPDEEYESCATVMFTWVSLFIVGVNLDLQGLTLFHLSRGLVVLACTATCGARYSNATSNTIPLAPGSRARSIYPIQARSYVGQGFHDASIPSEDV